MKNKKKSLGSPKNTGSANGNSTARLVITNTSGRQVASAPALQLTPNRFHLRKILVPVDFSDCSRKALRYAIPFAKQFGASLTLLFVTGLCVAGWNKVNQLLADIEALRRKVRS